MLKLDVFVRYDNDLAQILFDDFKNGADGSHVLLLGDRSTEYCVIFENEQIANQPHFKRSRLQKLTKSELYKIENNFNLTDELIDNIAKSELIDLLLTINNKDFYKNEYENKSYYDFDFDFEISGYSQSNALKVKKIGSAEWCANSYSADYLTNLFFDSPISGKIQFFELIEGCSGFINDCEQDLIFEIDIGDLLCDLYNYSKAEIVSNFAKLRLAKFSDKLLYISNKYNIIIEGYIKRYLDKNLPDHPEYE